jgi:nicotinic acid mononucleotide adenylyltransferase
MDNEKKKDRKSFKEHDPSKYINTEPVLDEAAKGKTAVVTFGRMNPITVGHEKLVNKVVAEASFRKATPMVFLSHSSDSKKNPLSYNNKVKFAQQAFGNIVMSSKARTIIEVAKSLSGKYGNFVVVVGQDRMKEFSTLLQKYNGKEYNFEKIDVVSAGQRDPDSEGVEGMSASKMRALAAQGNMDEFKKGLPKKLQRNAKEVYNAVRAGMDITERLDEALSRAGRRKRAMAMRRARAKIKLGRERARKKRAGMDVLKKRARKRAMNKLKDRFSRHKRYSDLSPAEKEQIEKRIAKVNKSRIERMAQKELIYVKRADRDKFKQVRVESFSKFTEDYYKGVPKDKKDDREAHFKRNAEKPGDGPDKDSNYKPAPGDFKDGKRVKTKVSKHTKKYKQMYGESEEWVCGVCHADPCVCDGDNLQLHEMWGKYTTKRPHMLMDKDNKPKFDKRFKMFKPKQVQEMNEFELEDIVELMELTEDYALELNEDPTASLKKKAEKTGMPMGILRKVYNRGVAAWKSGHRPGTTPEQWGHARVNSFVTKSSGTWGKADSDLAAKVRKEEVDLEEEYHITKIYNPTTKASRAAKKSTATYAVHTKDRKYFKEFPSQKEAEAHMKSLGKKEETELDEVKRGRSTMKRLKDIQKDAENFKLKKEAAELDEVLDTPKAMDSYRNKAKASKEKAASSAVAKMVRSKDKDNRAHPAAELKTMAKRTVGQKMVDRLAKRKTFKKLRNEAFNIGDDHDAAAHAHMDAHDHHKKAGHDEIAKAHRTASDHHDKAAALHRAGKNQEAIKAAYKAVHYAGVARMFSQKHGGEHHSITSAAQTDSSRLATRHDGHLQRNEEVEQLDELSPRTKASYLKKASAQNKNAQKAYDKSVKSSPDAFFGDDGPEDKERMKIMTKRQKGIAMAKGRKYGQKYESLDDKFEAFLNEKSGAGEEGTPELVKKLKKDTPHA